MRRSALLVTNGMIMPHGEGLRLQLHTGRELRWQVYPAVELFAGEAAQRVEHLTAAPFAGGTMRFPESRITVGSALHLVAPPMDEATAKKPQCGMLYGAALAPVPGSTTWTLSVIGTASAWVSDHLLEITYIGDTRRRVLPGRAGR